MKLEQKSQELIEVIQNIAFMFVVAAIVVENVAKTNNMNN